MKFENLNSIDLAVDSFYLCKITAFSESGYSIAKAISVISCKKSNLVDNVYVNPTKKIVLESTENGDILDCYNILGVMKLDSLF